MHLYTTRKSLCTVHILTKTKYTEEVLRKVLVFLLDHSCNTENEDINMLWVLRHRAGFVPSLNKIHLISAFDFDAMCTWGPHLSVMRKSKSWYFSLVYNNTELNLYLGWLNTGSSTQTCMSGFKNKFCQTQKGLHQVHVVFYATVGSALLNIILSICLKD